MSRLVVPASAADAVTRERGYGGAVTQDQYLDRVAKYIPGEAVGLYTSLDGVVNPINRALADPSQPVQVGLLTPWLPLIVFLAGMLLAFIWIWYLGAKSGNSTWKIQAVIAAVAFCVWAYAIKGSFFFQNPALDQFAKNVFGTDTFYNPSGAMILLILFSTLIAFYEPKGEGG